MRRAVLCLTALAALSGAAAARPHPRTQPAAAAANQPPHAWLFGVWTGGLFPVLDGMAGQDCRTQPTVGFTKDAVSHATLLGATMTDRAITTVRATGSGAEFRFTPAADPAAGFGCENSDELHVLRSGPNQISFPNCAAFPYPLERCAG